MIIKKLKLVLILLTILSTNQVFGQLERIHLNEWITNWYLLGPLPLEKEDNELKHLPGFENDFLSEHGGESDPIVEVDKEVRFGKNTASWIEYTSNDSVINLDAALSQKSFVVAYAYKEIFVENEGTYIISLGTNDGGRLWLNGVEVWDYTRARGVTPDEDLIPVLLKKGKNKLLLKVEERGHSWGFAIRILPFNIDAFTREGRYFKVVTLPSGESELRFPLSEKVIEYLFKYVDLEIYMDNNDDEIIWKGKWNKKQRMSLDLDIKEVRKYIVKITAFRKDDKKWQSEIKFTSGKRMEYSLFSNRETDYNIIVSDAASESEKWAAKELQKYLLEISGAVFEIIDDNVKVGEKEIIVGYNKHTKMLLGEEYRKPGLLDESFLYENIASNIILIGGEQRGTMYAVFSFLENAFGVRWYTPAITIVPKRKEYVFNYINHSEKPSIKVRNDFYFEAFDPTWAAHNKINGAMGYRKQYGGIEGYWGVHTFYQFMPPAEFYDEHPEYYSLNNGKRVFDSAQLCLTNSDVLDIITERLRKVMRENPSNLIYSVSQNDWSNPCQCSNCQAIVDEKGGQAGIMVWFVNKVADSVKEEFPNKYVGTLAYRYTRKSPVNIKPNENVVIRLCSIECCFAHDFNSCPENEEFLSDMEKWSEISPHMYIWDYVVNFSHYIMPYPNFNVLQPNIKAFRDNSSIGIMEQAAYQSRGGEFAELRSYIIAKLLWNADSDVDNVVNDFIYGYYGRSGQYIREYFDLLQSLVKKDTHIYFDSKPDDKIFTDKFIIDADVIFDKAEIVAVDNEMKKRVEMARLPLMYLKCRKNPIDSKYDGTYARFNKIVEREGITHYAEAGKPHIDAFNEQVINAK